MKKISLVATLVLALGVSAFAGEKKAMKAEAKPAAAKMERMYGMAGCGLGALAMGRDGNQILAGTTNNLIWPQTFAITTGISHCTDSPSHETAARMDNYINANKVAVAGDVARGGGETVANLSSIMGCPEAADAIGAEMQKNFGTIFPNAQVDTMSVTDSMITVVRQNDALAQACQSVAL